MWAQPDGRPAEYRWHPLFNAAIWLTSNLRLLRLGEEKKERKKEEQS